jgi:hypothetical protein
MSSQERQPTRVGLTIGSTTRLNEFDFAKISLSLERDLVPAENPIDAYRDIKALLERMVNEFQAGKPSQMSDRSDNSNTSAAKAKENLPLVENHATFTAVNKSKILLPVENQPVSPRPAASKLATLQERLGARMQDVEVVEGFDGLSIKPKKYLGDAWAEINEVVRSLGGKWQKGLKSTDGAWRIPK